MIMDLCTGAAIATNSVENKAQTALAQEVSLRRARRATAPLGGTQHLELDMGSDVLTNRTKVFAESQGWLLSDFAAGNPRPRGGVERPHQTIKRKLRMLRHSSCLPSDQSRRPESQVTLLNGNIVSWSFKRQTIVTSNPPNTPR